MAEVVSRRIIGNKIHRLSVFRANLNRPLCDEESPAGLVVLFASCHIPAKEGCDVQLLSKNRVGRVTEKLYRLKKAEHQEKYVVFLDAASFHLPSSRFICCSDPIERLQPSRTGLLISGLLREQLLTCCRSPWTRGVVFVHSDAFRSPQQLRSLCTSLYVLTENLSGELRCCHIWRGSTPTRGFSSESEGPSHPHRSRTTYYDVLKVSPNATQSHIKTAYYKQSFIHHPDKNEGSKEATRRFSEINEAYTILSDVNQRRRYNQSINQFGVHRAMRPSTKETSSRFTGHHPQQRASQFYQPNGRPIYDFDAFYRAHYGRQLEREWARRARNKEMEENQHLWKYVKIIEISVVMMMTVAGMIFIAVNNP